jgi:ribosome maturation factor RimP
LSKIAEQVKAAIARAVAGENCEIVDVEYERKYGAMHLTVFIDAPGGVTLDDCERVHKAIDPVLDELNPTADAPYVLNVSSPGLDRPFKTLRDFERNYNREVEVKLYAPRLGQKLFEGVLTERTEHTTTITADGQVLKFENGKIALVRPLIKFE